MTKMTFMIATALSVFAVASSAVAQDMGKRASATYGNNYIRLDGGAMWITDTSFSSGLSAHDVTTTAAGDYSFDMGTTFSGTVGYRFSKQLRGELEFNYTKADFDAINGNMTVTTSAGSTAVVSSKSVSGDVTMMGGLANVMFDVGNDKNFTPYIGGGLGFFNVKSRISKIGTLIVNGEETDTHLAASLTAGADFKVQDNLRIGARYRYFWVNSQKAGLDNMDSNSVMATLTFDL